MLTIRLYKSFLDKHIVRAVNLYLASSWIFCKSKLVYEIKESAFFNKIINVS
jgi:regulator of sirC expression with transglutaminase-like and TPR domain